MWLVLLLPDTNRSLSVTSAKPYTEAMLKSKEQSVQLEVCT